MKTHKKTPRATVGETTVYINNTKATEIQLRGLNATIRHVDGLGQCRDKLVVGGFVLLGQVLGFTERELKRSLNKTEMRELAALLAVYDLQLGMEVGGWERMSADNLAAA